MDGVKVAFEGRWSWTDGVKEALDGWSEGGLGQMV